jgi:hypothetical protein
LILMISFIFHADRHLTIEPSYHSIANCYFDLLSLDTASKTMMVSSFIHLSIVAALGGAAYNAHAQLSTLPKRYRRTSTIRGVRQTTGDDASSTVVLGRPIQQESENIVKRKTRQLEESEELSLSMALESATIDLSNSMPTIAEAEFGTSSMSLSLEQAELGSSMPTIAEAEFGISSMSLSLDQAELGSSMPNLEQAELSMPNLEQAELSMPIFEDLTRTLNDEPASETVPINKSDASSTVILSSFIAGLSVLVVGASAMVLKMKRLRAREIEQDQPRMVYDIQVERA